MHAQRQPRQKRKPHPYIPGATTRQRDPFFGGIETRVVCADNRVHEYLNAGVPQEALPRPVYSACPSCGKATAPLINTIGIPCEECRWEAVALQIEMIEARDGIVIMPRHEDPAFIRELHGYRPENTPSMTSHLRECREDRQRVVHFKCTPPQTPMNGKALKIAGT